MKRPTKYDMRGRDEIHREPNGNGNPILNSNVNSDPPKQGAVGAKYQSRARLTHMLINPESTNSKILTCAQQFVHLRAVSIGQTPGHIFRIFKE